MRSYQVIENGGVAVCVPVSNVEWANEDVQLDQNEGYVASKNEEQRIFSESVRDDRGGLMGG